MQLLNPEQQQAVQTIDKPLLVIAGAGSGKTRVITEKIAYLINVCQTKPQHIYAVTFTNKAAAEMRERVRNILNSNTSKLINVSTFHSLGLQIVRYHHKELQLTEKFSILDSQDAKTVLQQIVWKDYNQYSDLLETIQATLSRWKNELVDDKQALVQAENDLERVAAHIFTAYKRYLRAYNAIDFDDLIVLPVQLLAGNDSVRQQWQTRIHHLLVDEYQDTNTCQYKLVQLLVGDREAFTLVGDDDQSIYAWRGARSENLLILQQDYRRLKVIKLEQNYRSCERILLAANQLIANNPHHFAKKLWSNLGLGEKIRILPTHSEQDEVERVIKDLQRHKIKHGSKYCGYAILYRGNHQARPFEKALREQRIPYRITGQTSFFAYAEVKDLLAYARLLCNPDDDVAFLRIVNTPKREIGPATLEKLSQYARQRQCSLLQAADELGLSQILSARPLEHLRAFAFLINSHAEEVSTSQEVKSFREFVEKLHYEDWLYQQFSNAKAVESRMKRIEELLTWIENLFLKEPSRQFVDVIKHLALLDLLDNRVAAQEADDEIQLMTLHAAKGLEFPFVYLIGMEEELLPHRSSIEANNIEEERRLAYVGMTRAKKHLMISFAQQRQRHGEKTSCEPSRFLAELPEEHCTWEGKAIEYSNEETEMIASTHLNNLRELLGSYEEY